MKKNEKRGFLLAEETLKIIIAVISIGFLIYFLAALYFASRDAEKLEQAGASLEFLINDIPNSCLNIGWEKCICICENTLLDLQGSYCDNKGICMQSDFEVQGEGNQIELNNLPLTLNINHKNKKIEKLQ